MTFSLTHSNIWRLFRMNVRKNDFIVVWAVRVFLFKWTFARINRSGKCCWLSMWHENLQTHDNGKLDNSFKAVQCRSIDHFFSKTEVNSLLACLSSGFIWQHGEHSKPQIATELLLQIESFKFGVSLVSCVDVLVYREIVFTNESIEVMLSQRTKLEPE